MLFALMCTDKPDSVDLRIEIRPAHIAYLHGLGDTLKAGGPCLNAEGQPIGSLVIVEAADKAGAEEIAANDPYSKAGLFDSVDIRQWDWRLKNPES